MSAGVNEDAIQFQAVPIQLDPKQTDLAANLKRVNQAVAQLQEQVVQMRSRIIALEERVLD